jgi:hypothetical protein
VQRSQGVLEPGMGGTRVDKVSQPQLFYPSESLKIRMFNEFKKTLKGDLDKSVYRIIDDLFFVGINSAHWQIIENEI